MCCPNVGFCGHKYEGKGTPIPSAVWVVLNCFSALGR